MVKKTGSGLLPETCCHDFLHAFRLLLEKRLSGIDLYSIIRSYRRRWGRASAWDPVLIKRLMLKGTDSEKDLQGFAGYLYMEEKSYKYRIFDVMAVYLEAYEDGTCISG